LQLLPTFIGHHAKQTGDSHTVFDRNVVDWILFQRL